MTDSPNENTKAVETEIVETTIDTPTKSTRFTVRNFVAFAILATSIFFVAFFLTPGIPDEIIYDGLLLAIYLAFGFQKPK